MRKITLGLVLLGAFVFAGDDIITRKIDSDCKNGDNRSCYALALNYFNGNNGFSRDFGKAKFYFGRICRKGNENGGFFGEACFYLGVMYDDYGFGDQQDYKKALEFYTLACDEGNAGACASIGTIYNDGKGVSKDVAKGASYFKKACDLGQLMSCYIFANHALKNKDVGKASQYFNKACELGKSDPKQVRNDSNVKEVWELACNQKMLLDLLQEAEAMPKK